MVHRSGRYRLPLERRHQKPAFRPTAVDQLLCRKARSRTKVRKVALRSARPDTHVSCCGGDRTSDGDVRGEHLDLSRRTSPGQLSALAPVSHADMPAAANHSSRPSIGIVVVVNARPIPVGRAIPPFRAERQPVRVGRRGQPDPDDAGPRHGFDERRQAAKPGSAPAPANAGRHGGGMASASLEAGVLDVALPAAMLSLVHAVGYAPTGRMRPARRGQHRMHAQAPLISVSSTFHAVSKPRL
jgi:hypothetical protein